jgi:hypothetical protein
MAGKGQEDQFPSPAVSVRYRLGQATFAATHKKDAPIGTACTSEWYAVAGACFCCTSWR